MDVAALAVWVVTALTGFVLLGTWLAGGGLRQQASGRTRIRSPLIFSHFGLAATGLAAWGAFVATDARVLAWAAVVLLPVVATLGLLMYLQWLGGRGAHRGVVEADPPAEQRFPALVVGVHGVVAVVTVALALLAAAGVG